MTTEIRMLIPEKHCILTLMSGVHDGLVTFDMDLCYLSNCDVRDCFEC